LLNFLGAEPDAAPEAVRTPPGASAADEARIDPVLL
jgi:hypothetical protein